MNRLVRNVFSNWAGVIANLAISFFLSPFLVHRLGDAGYGLWVLVLSVTGYMGLLDSGLRVSIVKHTAEYNARGDREGLSRLLTTALLLYGVLSLLVLALAVFVSLSFDTFFKVPPSQVAVGRLLVLIAGLNVALTLPLSVYAGLLSGLQRYDLVNRAAILVLLIRSAATVAAVYSGYGLIALGLIQVAGQLLNAAMLVTMVRREAPAVAVRWRRPERAAVRSLYAYSGFIVLNNVAMFLLFYSGEVLVGIFVGTAAVTPYAIARSLVAYLSSFIGSMTQVFHPYASDQHERGNANAVADALFLGTKTSLLIALPVGVSYLIIGPAFLGLWMGPQYIRSAGLLLMLLAVPQVIWLSQSTAGNILLGINRHRVLTALNLATGVSGILLGIAAVGRLGTAGIAIGNAVPIIVTQAVVLPIYTARSLGVSLTKYFTAAYLGPLLSVVPFAAVLFAISRAWPAPHLPALAAQIAVSLVVFAVSACFLAFNRAERQVWAGRLRLSRRLASETL